MAERECLILGFVLLATAGFFFGSVQRTALLVARASDKPPGSPAMNLLLPRFLLIAPLTIAAKWAALLAYGFRHSWLQAIALLVAAFFIDAALPEPTGLAVRLIKKRIAKIEPAGATEGLLWGMLEAWEREGRPELHPGARDLMRAQNLRVSPREKAVKSFGCLVLNLALAGAAIYIAFFLLRTGRPG